MITTGMYILDESGNAVAVADTLTWAQWFEANHHRRSVARDHFGDVLVSTVFLGIDHRFHGDGPPILWETLVFGGPLDGEGGRYASLADALRGHAAMVARVAAVLEGQVH